MTPISQRLRGMHTPVRVSLPLQPGAEMPTPTNAVLLPNPSAAPAAVGGHESSVATEPPPPPIIERPTLVASGADTSAWTIPLICFGVALIACCVLIPAADENRRLSWERERLRADLQTIKKQIDINDRFLVEVADDPTLLQRLAQRQMRLLPTGTSALDMSGSDVTNIANQPMNPFLLLTLPPPPPLPTYRPVGGVFSTLCREPRPRLIFIAIALVAIAAGLVLEAPDLRRRRPGATHAVPT